MSIHALFTQKHTLSTLATLVGVVPVGRVRATKDTDWSFEWPEAQVYNFCPYRSHKFVNSPNISYSGRRRSICTSAKAVRRLELRSRLKPVEASKNTAVFCMQGRCTRNVVLEALVELNCVYFFDGRFWVDLKEAVRRACKV